MKMNRRMRRYYKTGKANQHPHNNRKTTNGRYNQYVQLENGKTKLIQQH